MPTSGAVLRGICARCHGEAALKETRNGPLICEDDRACDERFFARTTDPAPPPDATCESAHPIWDVGDP